jgi:hypothetical protein
LNGERLWYILQLSNDITLTYASKY